MHTACLLHEHVTDQLDFPALLICGCTIDRSTTLTQLHHSRILSPESVSVTNCRSVFASSTPTSKGKFNRCPEALGVGIRFITMKTDLLGPYNEDTKIPDSSAFSQVAVRHFGNVFGEF